MKLLAFTIRDDKSEHFMQPFFCSALGQASRQFGDSVLKEGSLIHDHPEDFGLYHTGYFDSETGKMIPNEQVNLIARGPDFLPAQHLKEVKKN